MCGSSPWIAEANFFAGMDGLPFMVTTISEAGNDTETVAFTTSKGRANLIAAAPLLLTVARNTVLALTSAGIEAKAVSDNPVEVLLFNAEAAIARAEAIEPSPGPSEADDPDWIPY